MEASRPIEKIDPETERIIIERLEMADQEPRQDYWEALADVLRDGHKEVARLKQLVPR